MTSTLPTTTLRLPADAIARAAELLLAQRLVALPTETVYGLAARADRPDALLAIFAAKGRPTFDPLIGHVPSDWTLESLVKRGWVDGARLASIQNDVERMIAAFWPGPLTLLLPAGPVVESCGRIMTSGSDWVALRMPSHPVMQAVLQTSDLVLAAPSANRFGRISPTDAQAVLAELDGRIDAVVDAGPCVHGVESTLIGPEWKLDEENNREIVLGRWRCYRPGALALEPVSQCLGVPVLRHTSAANLPGALASHYAPQSKLVLHEFSGDRPLEAGRVERFEGAWMFTARKSPHGSRAEHRSLTTSEDPVQAAQEAAQNLFRTLRELDGAQYDVIHVELPPAAWQAAASTIWPALVDRLQRAAFK